MPFVRVCSVLTGSGVASRLDHSVSGSRHLATLLEPDSRMPPPGLLPTARLDRPPGGAGVSRRWREFRRRGARAAGGGEAPGGQDPVEGGRDER